jgi:rRNA-processing protein FCF1
MLLKPGCSCDQAIRLTETLGTETSDVQYLVPHILITNGPTGAAWPERLSPGALVPAIRKYDEWTLQAATRLRAAFTDPAISARPRAEKYSLIVNGDPSAGQTAILINGELNELRSYFAELANRAREQQEHYRWHQGRTLILDTNDLLHGQDFINIPWRRDYGPDTVVALPHVVIDEIDQKSFAQSEKTRKRARVVFRQIERLLDQIDAGGEATLTDGTPFRVLADEPGHQRLPNNDDEVVAQACALHQAIQSGEVVVITWDNGMRTRAKAWGLKAARLDEKYRRPEGDGAGRATA